MKSTRRSAVVGAVGATLLLLTGPACASESDDATSESLGAAAVETTVADTETPDTETPDTETPGTDEPATGGDDPAPTEAPAAVVPEALQFTAPLVGGGTFDGAAAAGKPTVFWFWAPT